jgi:hypothetical protein
MHHEVFSSVVHQLLALRKLIGPGSFIRTLGKKRFSRLPSKAKAKSIIHRVRSLASSTLLVVPLQPEVQSQSMTRPIPLVPLRSSGKPPDIWLVRQLYK